MTLGFPCKAIKSCVASWSVGHRGARRQPRGASCRVLRISRTCMPRVPNLCVSPSFLRITASRSSVHQLNMAETNTNAQLNGSSSKPRARLGPTEIVHLPNSDSEGEDDDYVQVNGNDAREQPDPNFLRDQPDDTEVRLAISSCPTALEGKEARLTRAGSATAPFRLDDRCAWPAESVPLWQTPKAPLPTTECAELADPDWSVCGPGRTGGPGHVRQPAGSDVGG